MSVEATKAYFRELRKRNGWSQAELARRINVVPKTVERWEAGKMPEGENLINALRELGGSLDVFQALHHDPRADEHAGVSAAERAIPEGERITTVNERQQRDIEAALESGDLTEEEILRLARSLNRRPGRLKSWYFWGRSMEATDD